ncbi:MAG: tetratricopeptide repeat protein, partial [Bryobacterales bacterium]|nr:tetratricopeptide repeat protein [Bryobacterales bacterium]
MILIANAGWSVMTARDLALAALRTSPADRAAYLESMSTGDATLLAEARTLLAQMEGDPSLEPTRVTTPQSAPVHADDPFQPGDLVAGRFRIARKLAEGGMGVVYQAVDEKLNELRAVKVAKAQHIARLSPEARNALRITHPNVCRVFEIHTAATARGEVDFLTMEFIDGETLSQQIRREGALPAAVARDIALQMCAGLSAAHAINVLHRDLKSNNVMLTRDGKGDLRVVVMDFGLAQEGGDAGAPGGGVAGTPFYIAPELWRGARASVASDIYALGVVLHEMITGRQPAAVRDPGGGLLLTVDPACNGVWRTVISRCLDSDPNKRYGSAVELAEALSGRRQRRVRLAVATVAALVCVGVVWQALTPTTPPARLAVLPLRPLDTEPGTMTLVRGASHDLSNRLMHLHPRPPQLVIIPVEQSAAVAEDLDRARDLLGATHVLRGTVAHAGKRWVVRGAIVDTRTKLAVREVRSQYADTDSNSIAGSMLSLTASVFHLPRQSSESLASAAYRDYAEGMSLVRERASAYDAAIAAFERAMALDPKSALPRAGLAEACYNAFVRTQDRKWLERGRAAIAEAERLNPDSIAVRLASGKMNLIPGSAERAAQDFQRVLQLDANNAEGWRGVALAYQQMPDRQNDAVAAFLKAIDLQPGYSRPVRELGDFYRSLGHYEEAERHWRRVTEMLPQSADAHSNLGGLYSDMGKWDEAERELRRALQIDPQYRVAMNNLGALYQYVGRDHQAVAVLEQARKIGPESAVLLLNMGDSYRRLGRGREAAEAYGKARRLAEAALLTNPRDVAMRAFLAYFAMRLGDRRTAEQELAQALSLGGQNRTVVRRAAILYEAMGQRERALGVLQSAPFDVVRELNRQPDMRGLSQDARFR